MTTRGDAYEYGWNLIDDLVNQTNTALVPANLIAALEGLVDRVGLTDLLAALSAVAGEKGERISREHLNAKGGERWERVARRVSAAGALAEKYKF